jgi:D-alanyl-D-alanine carboxypeptidase/D-alanyl-D-alanine-endopeptidase (penicillin-binding protein 4)
MIMKSLFALILILLPQLVLSATWKDKADSVIREQIASSGIPSKHFAVWVKKQNMSTHINGDKAFVPASLSKIPTALTFLDQFSMDQYFHTWVYKTGSIKEGVLTGDLYLKGGGDPTFVSESMWRLINELKRSDVRKIKGKLYVDESYFDKDYYSEGRQKRRVDRAYDAPVSALSFNWNSVSIYVRPGKANGHKARVYLDPPVPFVKIINKARTTSSSKTKLKVSRKIKGQSVEIIVRGEISSSKDEKAFYKSIGDAALWTGLNFKYYLNQFGIEYSGDVAKKKVPSHADMLVELDSWSMGRVVSAMSKFSNNFVAEMITKQLGKTEKVPGNIDDGLDKITAYLKKNGWQSGKYSFVNPSGFTRDNKMRAEDLGELLHTTIKNFSVAPEFLAALPISGTDGTLKRRMRQVMKGKVRAKTGYLTGVVGLAGFLQSKTGHHSTTFVFFYNGPYKHDWEVRALFDKILWRLYQAS